MAVKTGPRKVRSAQRRAEVMRLREEGHKFPEIGRRLGISHVAAWKHCQRGLEEAAKQLTESAETIRAIELNRLDRALVKVFRKVDQGDLAAVDRLIKIQERRAKLLGLDAAEKYEHSGAGGGPIQVSELRGKVAEKLAILRAKGTADGTGG
jgi:predicted DNA-binding protein (UPF0251 family)